MKIALRVFSVMCFLLALLAILLPLPLPPASDAMQQATEDAKSRLSWPAFDMLEPTNDVTVKRATLKVLTERAELPANTWRSAQFFSRTTCAFAFVSGISLFLLSRKVGK